MYKTIGKMRSINVLRVQNIFQSVRSFSSAGIDKTEHNHQNCSHNNKYETVQRIIVDNSNNDKRNAESKPKPAEMSRSYCVDIVR